MSTGPDTATRLFCLPWAGGGAAAFQRGWPRHLVPGLEVHPVELPGRGAEFDEPPARRLETLLDFLEKRLTPLLGEPYAVFGHSMGTLVAFELTRRFAAAGLPLPRHLFLSGSGRPGQAATTLKPMYLLPEDEFRAWLYETGGTPAEVFDNPELLDLLSPMVRADFELCHTYRYRPGPPLAMPLTVFGGDADPFVPVAALREWAELTTGPCEQVVLSGGHFAFRDQLPRVHAHIVATLRPAPADR
ncbi:thioesterase II family protein [Streptomyces litchfieldiae]|uniref:Alpha/beta fold hydrolase n=1 Tax=Streptomyces litchfieldiae TaxID=3075543 RepID=A0ABU2MPQ8_9ACTN|nr:alpha/beta fold hydrolase [Streptomyces sp. DSM 44938]MDT0343456.1 alpha/beta fold hydrolase [Streptomyces sp. DSM 44938]